MTYCPKCGGTGIDINGNPCSCVKNVTSFFESVSCLDIPEQYRGVQFSKILVPSDLHPSYPNYLQSVYDKVLSGQWKQQNAIICSPINHSKTILAYSCIEVLFRSGITTFPVYDVLEIKRMLIDMDLCRKSIYEEEHPEYIISAPLLFIKIPRVSNWEVFDTIALVLDRRVRRGNSTIFLYDGSWQQLIYNDRNQILVGLQGDGNYSTVDVKSWYVPTDTGKKTIEPIVADNLG